MIRLWLLRLICPKGYTVVRGLPITQHSYLAGRQIRCVGVSASDTKAGDVMALVSQGYYEGSINTAKEDGDE